MRRAAITFTVLSGLLLILGLVDYLTNYNFANDQGTIFGNPNVVVNDGATLLIAGGFLVLVSALMWILARRKDQGDQRQS
ncbi:MAG TPA: hypothetical protein VF983_12570 [Streptosporangiaceae bacterium]